MKLCSSDNHYTITLCSSDNHYTIKCLISVISIIKLYHFLIDVALSLPLRVFTTIESYHVVTVVKNTLQRLKIFRIIIVTRKEIVWKQCLFFYLCNVPALTSAQSFRNRTKSSGVPE